MRKISVTLAAVKGETSYTWYKVKSRVQPMDLRGKEVRLVIGDVIGLRSSSNGQSTRMVKKDNIGYVMSPSMEQVKYLLKKCEPLIGGPVDSSKIGLVEAPKLGVKERRIEEELNNLTHVLKAGADITDIKVKDKRLYFKYKGRPYGIVSDPS